MPTNIVTLLKTISWSPIIIIILVSYFLISDYGLYEQIQKESNLNITITVKAFMLDHVNAFILQPLTEFFVHGTNILEWFPWIQANHVSYLGVVFAIIAARLILSDDLFIRRLGVLAFFGRQFMDDLDGYIARYRMGIDTNKQVSVTNSSGYIVDGICDGIGTVIFWFALFYRSSTINSNHRQKITYLSLESGSHSYNNRTKNYLLLLIQIGLSSLFWNILLNQYHDMLDPSIQAGFSIRTPQQEEIFKSSLVFMIMWLWRCLNPHALMNYLLISIWLDRIDHYIRLSNQYIFYIIISLSFLCIVHLNDIKYRLSKHIIQQL